MAGKLNLFSLKKVLDNVQVPKSSNDAASNDTHQRLQRIQMLTSLTLDSDQTNPMGYEKVKIVGKGSFGIAILYRREADNKYVVFKQINLSYLTKMEKELAMNEVDVFSKLHHPNIICYLGSFIEDDILLIEMEYADGGTLAEIISERSPNNFMAEKQIMHIFEQIISAINYMHSESILHRDLKTANVFMNKRGIIKIGDFGISKIMNTQVHAQTVLGTPYYFSPEMCEGKEYDDRSDIWAAGCILCEMCALQKAFSANNLSELVTKIMKGQYIQLPHGYSEGLQDLIRMMLKVNATERPSASEILKYWIPLAYRSNSTAGKNNSTIIQFPKDHPSAKKANEEASTMTRNFMEQPTAQINDPPVKRSVLYQMKGFRNSFSLTPLQLPPTMTIASLATNGSHFLVISSDGSVYASGEGSKGQLGSGNCDIWRHYPSRIDALRKYKIISAAAGDGFSIFLTDEGVVLSCGDNSNGCLGHEECNNLTTPKILDKFYNIRIIQISCGPTHVIALSSDKMLFTWGNSSAGALGMGSTHIKCPTPRRILTAHMKDNISRVYAGPECSILFMESGNLYVCGSNSENRFGFGSTTKKIVAFKRILPKNLLCDRKVIDVSVSTEYAAFLIEGGYVITLGINNMGQRGNGHSQPTNNATLVTGIEARYITKIKCYSTYATVVSDENIISIWGTRYGVSSGNDPNELVDQQFGTKTPGHLDMGNSTVAFTNFLASIYKSELIHDPMDVLAIYSSAEQVSKGYYIVIKDIFPLQDSILVVVDTTTPLK